MKYSEMKPNQKIFSSFNTGKSYTVALHTLRVMKIKEDTLQAQVVTNDRANMKPWLLPHLYSYGLPGITLMM